MRINHNWTGFLISPLIRLTDSGLTFSGSAGMETSASSAARCGHWPAGENRRSKAAPSLEINPITPPAALWRRHLGHTGKRDEDWLRSALKQSSTLTCHIGHTHAAAWAGEAYYLPLIFATTAFEALVRVGGGDTDRAVVSDEL